MTASRDNFGHRAARDVSRQADRNKRHINYGFERAGAALHRQSLTATNTDKKDCRPTI